jgi:hypothetical protein
MRANKKSEYSERREDQIVRDCVRRFNDERKKSIAHRRGFTSDSSSSDTSGSSFRGIASHLLHVVTEGATAFDEFGCAGCDDNEDGERFDLIDALHFGEKRPMQTGFDDQYVERERFLQCIYDDDYLSFISTEAHEALVIRIAEALAAAEDVGGPEPPDDEAVLMSTQVASFEADEHVAYQDYFLCPVCRFVSIIFGREHALFGSSFNFVTFILILRLRDGSMSHLASSYVLHCTCGTSIDYSQLGTVQTLKDRMGALYLR